MSSKYIDELDKFTKEASENSSNAVSHLNLVEALTRQADKSLQQYHKLVETFRQQLQFMKNKILNNHQQIYNTTNPLIDATSSELQMGIIGQKQQNLNFQNQLTELKKQKSILGQMTNASLKRTEYLLQQVGNY